LVIRAALLGKATEAVPISGRCRYRRLHLHAPCLTSARDDKVDLNLVLIAIVPEAQVGIGPARLRDELFGFGSGVTSCHEGGMGSHQDDAAVDGSSAPSESQTAVISVLMRLF
jgi:hypothetical protein